MTVPEQCPTCGKQVTGHVASDDRTLLQLLPCRCDWRPPVEPKRWPPEIERK